MFIFVYTKVVQTNDKKQSFRLQLHATSHEELKKHLLEFIRKCRNIAIIKQFNEEKLKLLQDSIKEEYEDDEDFTDKLYQYFISNSHLEVNMKGPVPTFVREVLSKINCKELDLYDELHKAINDDDNYFDMDKDVNKFLQTIDTYKVEYQDVKPVAKDKTTIEKVVEDNPTTIIRKYKVPPIQNAPEDKDIDNKLLGFNDELCKKKKKHGNKKKDPKWMEDFYNNPMDGQGHTDERGRNLHYKGITPYYSGSYTEDEDEDVDFDSDEDDDDKYRKYKKDLIKFNFHGGKSPKGPAPKDFWKKIKKRQSPKNYQEY